MRPLLTFIFALFYTLVSTGTPALLHFCAHAGEIHLSASHEDHHNTPSCCHEEQKTCHSPQPNKEHKDDDCCITGDVDLDEGHFISSDFFTLSSLTSQKKNLEVSTTTATYSLKTQGPVQNNGPPLYLRYQQIIVYA